MEKLIRIGMPIVRRGLPDIRERLGAKIMETTRKEIAPGVSLTYLHTDKFKTGFMSLTLLTQLTREDAAKNALIPYVLRRGTLKHPDMEALSATLDDLYGARIEPAVRKKGEIQCIGFFADFVDDAYVPGHESIVEKISQLMGELLLSPNTRGGLLLPQYVDSEKEKLIERIRSVINDKTSYSVHRLRELMCFSEDYAVSAIGTEEAANSIGYQKLTKHYRKLLMESPIEIFYCGSAELWRVERAVTESLSTLPRGDINVDIGTDIRLNAIEDEPRIFTEELDVTQGKLAIGFRLGDGMLDPDAAALTVLNAVYGGALTSKLFTHVRERLSLCYFASSSMDRHKGVMFAYSGIEFDKYDEALSEILAQLEAVKDGDITDEELDSAKRYVATHLRASMDSPAALEDFWLSQNIGGLPYGPEELAALCEDVAKGDVVKLAGGIQCDAIYFLRGISDKEAD